MNEDELNDKLESAKSEVKSAAVKILEVLAVNVEKDYYTEGHVRKLHEAAKELQSVMEKL